MVAGAAATSSRRFCCCAEWCSCKRAEAAARRTSVRSCERLSRVLRCVACETTVGSTNPSPADSGEEGTGAEEANLSRLPSAPAPPSKARPRRATAAAFRGSLRFLRRSAWSAAAATASAIASSVLPTRSCTAAARSSPVLPLQWRRGAPPLGSAENLFPGDPSPVAPGGSTTGCNTKGLLLQRLLEGSGVRPTPPTAAYARTAPVRKQQGEGVRPTPRCCPTPTPTARCPRERCAPGPLRLPLPR